MDVSALAPWPGIAGRIALVTGASRSIGAAIAEALGRQGAIVIGTATSEQGARAIDAKLSELGLKGRGAVLDVAQRSFRRGAARGHWRARGPARDPREQRRHHARQPSDADEDGGMGRRVVDESLVDLSPLQGVLARHDEGALRPDRQHRLDRRVERQSRADELRGGEGGPDRLHEGAGGRNCVAKHHGQRRRAGVHRHRHDARARREAGPGATRARSRSRVSAASRTSRRPSFSSSRTPAPISPARRST